VHKDNGKEGVDDNQEREDADEWDEGEGVDEGKGGNVSLLRVELGSEREGVWSLLLLHAPLDWGLQLRQRTRCFAQRQFPQLPDVQVQHRERQEAFPERA
jgi:hypothetical protein